jgi:hypothetical protein
MIDLNLSPVTTTLEQDVRQRGNPISVLAGMKVQVGLPVGILVFPKILNKANLKAMSEPDGKLLNTNLKAIDEKKGPER